VLSWLHAKRLIELVAAAAAEVAAAAVATAVLEKAH